MGHSQKEVYKITEGFVLYPMAVGDHSTIGTSGEDRRRDNKNQMQNQTKPSKS